MGRSRIDEAAVRAIRRRPDVQGALKEVAYRILEDSDRNIIEMGAIDSGRMIRSGKVEQEDGLTRVSYYTIRTPSLENGYAGIVHDGTGIGRNAVPRPFLLNAAVRDRGTL